MYRWLLNHIPPKVGLWAKLFLFSTTMHIIFLICFFLIPDGSESDFSFSIRTRINSDVTVVYIPGHKTVMPAQDKKSSATIAENSSDNTKITQVSEVRAQTFIASKKEQSTKLPPVLPKKLTEKKTEVIKKIETKEPKKSIEAKEAHKQVVTKKLVAKKVDTQKTNALVQDKKTIPLNNLKKSNIGAQHIIVGTQKELVELDRAISIKNELERWWVAPHDSMLDSYCCTIEFEIGNNYKPTKIKTLQLTGNLMYESTVKRAIMSMNCNQCKPGGLIRIIAKGEELEIWLQ